MSSFLEFRFVVCSVLVLACSSLTRLDTKSLVSRSESAPDAGPPALRQCVAEYAGLLDGVRPGLGESIRNHSLTPTATSDRVVLFGAGAGTTGTTSLQHALQKLGLNVWHWVEESEEAAHGWSGQLLEIMGGAQCPDRDRRCINREMSLEETQLCRHKLRTFDYTNLPSSVDAVMDTPISELFLNIFLSFPKARYILTSRPSSDWARERWAHAESAYVPMQEPCDAFIGRAKYSTSELMQLYQLNDDFVRCVVPEDQLIQINLWTDPISRTDSLMAELASFTRRPMVHFEFPKLTQDTKSDEDVEDVEEASLQMPRLASLLQTEDVKVAQDISLHVFVLNIRKRDDRRACMNSQLRDAPYPVTYVDAVTTENVLSKCGQLHGLQSIESNGVSANFCTNYNLWRTMMNSTAHPEYLLVFEDDVALQSNFWARVKELVNSRCNNWDYLSVDIFKQPDDLPITAHYLAPVLNQVEGSECLRANGGMEPIGTLDGEGSHTALIRFSALNQLVMGTDRGGLRLPLDHWLQDLGSSEGQYPSIRAYTWQSRIVTQLGEWKTFEPDKEVPAECQASTILTSDVQSSQR